MQRILSSVVAIVCLAGCDAAESTTFVPSGDSTDSPQAVVAASGTTPETRDQTYLDGVMVQLESVRASVRRDVLARREFRAEDQVRLEAIFTGEALDFQKGVWQDAAHLGAPELNESPRNGTFPVTEIVVDSPDCVWFRSRPSDDYVVQPPQMTIDIVLVRKPHDESLNPTPWMISEFIPVGWLDANEVCK